MSDPRNVLGNKFAQDKRFSNFGYVLERIHISGFRGHSDTIIECGSPIIAFCGLNGTGKSTILQIAAVAYKNSESRNNYLRDFFVVSKLDPSPYTDTSKVVFSYCDGSEKTGQVTISRSTKDSSWSGYKRRRVRHVFFAGIGMYIPKVEKRDFTIYSASQLELSNPEKVSDTCREWIARIIGRSYDGVSSVKANSGKRSARVLSLERHGIEYSEAHMGFGEGRITYLVENLESIPDKSLVLIEEPETSLHPSAQHQLGHYLMDVSIRRGHQILLTTHSEFLLRSLPSSSRTYLHWNDSQLMQLTGLTASHATSLMSEGKKHALTVLVEDDCARAILTELVRKHDPNLLRSLHIHEAGSCTSIKTTMKCLESARMNVAAVLDADQSIDAKNNIFTLPGKLPPEKELVGNAQVQSHLLSQYSLEWTEFDSQNGLSKIDHHEWLPRLAERLTMDPSALTYELARTYACSCDPGMLITLLKEAMPQ